MDVTHYHKLFRLTVAVLVTLLFLLHSGGKLNLPLLERLEALAYDARVRFDLGNDIDPRIVIVDIDESSLRELGRWPWHRDQLAKMVDMLVGHYNVSLVGFDMVFVEPDDSSGLQVLRQLEQGGLADTPDFRRQTAGLRQSLQYDQRFAASLEHRPVVLGFFFQSYYSGGEQPETVGLLPPAITINNPELPRLPIIDATGYGANLPLLQQAAVGAGFIDIPVLDEDGVIRRAVLLQKYRGKYYPSLALSMILALLENPPIELGVAEGYGGEANYGLEQIKLAPGFSIPVDEYGSALVPYRNRYPAFRYLSASDVIHGRVDKSLLENTIVLVGTTAAGLLDNRNTPVQSVHPGVEVHASLLSGMLDRSLHHQPAYTRGADMLTLLLIAVLMIWWLPRLGAMGTLAASAALALLSAVFNYLLWRYGLIVLPLANQLGLIAMLFVFYTSFGFFVEQRAKRILAHRFGQYVPPEIVEEMSHDLGDYGLQGETRQMSVMFTDIRDFTRIADGLDPKDLTQLMNTYLTAMTRVIHLHRGTIDKYIGDAIMAFWGAPLSDPIHPRHAVEAAFEMIDNLVKVNEQLARRDMPQLEIGIGINSGEMNVGNMGSRFRMAYTVMGDTVNLASRFENLTRYYQVPIIVGENTKAGMADYEFRILDKVRFKGRDEITTLYQPMGRSAELSDVRREEIQQYHLALQAYYRQDWIAARSRFADLCRVYVDEALYQVYALRVEQLCEHPYDEQWDKVWLHDTVKQVLE